MWKGHSCVGAAHMCGRAFTCGSCSHVEGAFTCGSCSCVEGHSHVGAAHM